MTCYLPLPYLSFIPRRIILPASLPHSYPTILLTVNYIQVNHVYYALCSAAKSPRYLLNPLLAFSLSLEMTLHFQSPKLQIHSHHCQPRPYARRACFATAPSSSLLCLHSRTKKASPLEISPLSVQIQRQRASLGTPKSFTSLSCLHFPVLPILARPRPLCAGTMP